MRCPFCRNDNDKVIDTRSNDEGTCIRRRRVCLACQRRYTTHERLEHSPLQVIKKDGSRQSFNLEKVRKGISRALRKRPVSSEEVERLVEQIEADITSCYEREVLSTEIGESIMQALRRTDRVAYVRFASVYKQFEQVSEFIDEINKMETGGVEHGGNQGN